MPKDRDEITSNSINNLLILRAPDKNQSDFSTVLLIKNLCKAPCARHAFTANTIGTPLVILPPEELCRGSISER